ncbi:MULTISPECIES: sporulation protein [unclassified Aliivibrio]|jgi:sporulation-control protein|uniref:sporulation protein n=1 Tax=unclassified Aliivibrio TaxID=2645654 RepID=UPI00080DA472|nr:MULTISPECIES: sporulation protein [unclassified Aliivibrio]OCH15719.1 sporulation control protein Spo0M [Aliivibrio sp. 1S128]OCH18323.1 sporulation control protein Spo0M [Aliivibrio sp. 1S165]OCH35700.1 sporulation control protein Spo0M [Aliivibrio sp. 1S175]
MFKKLKASLGIGAAKVDTILENPELFQGDTLIGTVHIQGGDVEQQIDAIHLKLNTEVKVESDNGTSYQTLTLFHTQAVDPFVIRVGEKKEIRFTIKLPDETPITALNVRNNHCDVWVETVLDIDFAIDPTDRDLLVVKPMSVAATIINQIEQAGFGMVKADVEKGYLNGGHFKSHSGGYQEIEFRSNGFINKKEIELSFILDGQVLHCLAEVDRSMGFNRGDQYVSFSLNTNASSAEIHNAVQKILRV